LRIVDEIDGYYGCMGLCMVSYAPSVFAKLNIIRVNMMA